MEMEEEEEKKERGWTKQGQGRGRLREESASQAVHPPVWNETERTERRGVE